ncbi:hypothetical protein [Alteribacter lacisalsi]|nr:hypothetical protein [Alteribacter lacisalsi]
MEINSSGREIDRNEGVIDSRWCNIDEATNFDTNLFIGKDPSPLLR